MSTNNIYGTRCGLEQVRHWEWLTVGTTLEIYRIKLKFSSMCVCYLYISVTYRRYMNGKECFGKEELWELMTHPNSRIRYLAEMMLIQLMNGEEK